jgi:8-oxo-dGTP pyrophosphatase MutT (NUDIX family)
VPASKYRNVDLLTVLRERLRANPGRNLPPHSYKRAAVLVPVFIRDDVPHLLLTKRTEAVEHHKGQISFPGGGEEPGDEDLLATALRETYEELGLEPAGVEVWGRLDEIETVVSGFAITPYVGFIPQLVALRPNPNEIDEVVAVALPVFLDPSRVRTERVMHDGRPRELLYYDCGSNVVWGATARIIHGMVQLLAAERPESSRDLAGR